MSIDLNTAAVNARCQHLDHCAHDRKSADAELMRALVAERDDLATKWDWAASRVEDLEDRMAGARDAAYAAGRKEALEEAALWAESEGLFRTRDEIRALQHQNEDG